VKSKIGCFAIIHLKYRFVNKLREILAQTAIEAKTPFDKWAASPLERYESLAVRLTQPKDIVPLLRNFKRNGGG